MSVNLSAVQVRRPGLIETVTAALEAAGLAPGRLELEITESVLMSNTEANLRALRDLRSLGVRISLDDFGTGFSSLGYLGTFPFTQIKIDRSFVSGLATGPQAQAIVRSVIRLADDLGMTVTAEGVETPEQLERLKREGCAQAQGFLFARPKPAGHLPQSSTAAQPGTATAAA